MSSRSGKSQRHIHIHMPNQLNPHALNKKQARIVAVNVFGVTLSVLGSIMSITMILVGHTLGGECKIKAIDSKTFLKDEIRGHLPNWLIFSGYVILATSIVASMTVGAFPLMLRQWSKVVGGAIADIITGFLGKFVLALFYFAMIVCNLLGCLWVYLASINRTPANSLGKHAPNYCQPVVWGLSQFVTKSFWILSFIVGIRLSSEFYKLFRNDLGKKIVLRLVNGSKET